MHKLACALKDTVCFHPSQFEAYGAFNRDMEIRVPQSWTVPYSGVPQSGLPTAVCLSTSNYLSELLLRDERFFIDNEN